MTSRVMRFAVVGDTHYPSNGGSNFSPTVGEDLRQLPPPSPVSGVERLEMVVDRLLKEKAGSGLDFFVHIGDVITTNRPEQDAIEAKGIMDTVGLPYWVNYGNHDKLTETDWVEIFGHGRSHAFEWGDYGFIGLNSSNESGARGICIDEPYLINKLEEFKSKTGIFFFSHIPRYKGGFRGDPVTSPDNRGADSPDCTSIMHRLVACENLVCMIHGHFHEFNGVFSHRGIPVVFANHNAYYGLPYYGLTLFEVYDNGAVYALNDGFTGEKVGNEWVYTEAEKRRFNLDKFRGPRGEAGGVRRIYVTNPYHRVQL